MILMLFNIVSFGILIKNRDINQKYGDTIWKFIPIK